MKKLALTIALISTMALGANAQHDRNDAFVNSWDYDFRDEIDNINFVLPGMHGVNNDSNAPISSGLLFLTALGAGYAITKRKR